MRAFKHLTKTDRLRIEKWLNQDIKVAEIAEKLRVSKATVYRELKRGEYERLDGKTWEIKKAYSPDIAEKKYQNNLRDKGPELKIGTDQKYADFLEKTVVEKDCSPAAALAYAREEGFKTEISIPTFYSYIEKGVFLNLTQQQLPRHGKHKRGYKQVIKKKGVSRAPAGESIEKRPEEVKKRQEFGHWEGDTVYSGKKKSTVALFTLTERKTREEIIIKVPNRKAETIVKAMDALEKKWGAENFRAVFKSITFDNGTEFAAADQLERSCIDEDMQRTRLYFTHPYSSWERGSNENNNGMIRRKHPKGTSFKHVSKKEIEATQNWMNNYPRRILGYKTSHDLFKKCLKEIGITEAA